MIQDHSNSKIHTGLIIDFKLITFSKCEQDALLLLTRIALDNSFDSNNKDIFQRD